MRQVIFKKTPINTQPAVGSLIRSRLTGDFINIVLSISDVLRDEDGFDFRAIRSVRYAKVSKSLSDSNETNVTYLDGTRSRSIRWYKHPDLNRWRVVEEYDIKRVPVTITRRLLTLSDNETRRLGILSKMHGVDTTYRSRT
jgi:hypothetical protein